MAEQATAQQRDLFNAEKSKKQRTSVVVMGGAKIRAPTQVYY